MYTDKNGFYICVHPFYLWLNYFHPCRWLNLMTLGKVFYPILGLYPHRPFMMILDIGCIVGYYAVFCGDTDHGYRILIGV